MFVITVSDLFVCLVWLCLRSSSLRIKSVLCIVFCLLFVAVQYLVPSFVLVYVYSVTSKVCSVGINAYQCKFTVTL